MLSVHPATQAQQDKVFSTDKSFDSEAHCHVLRIAFLRLDEAPLRPRALALGKASLGPSVTCWK